MSRFLLTASFVVGALVGNLLVFQYAWRSRWRETITGRVLLTLFGVIALTYNVSALTLLLPDIFDGGIGLTFRIVVRFAIDVGLIGMYVLLVKAQRRDRAAPDEILDPLETVQRPASE
jgi:hypothetical protein